MNHNHSSSLQPSLTTKDKLWQRGFFVLLRRELRKWWFTRKLLISVILWTFLINVIGLASLGISVNTAGSTAQSAVQGLGLLFTLWTSLPMLGAAFGLQGILSDERKLGTMPWILSKPVFRSAFYLAKLVAHVLMGLLIIVLLQGVIVCLRFAAQGIPLDLPRLIVGMLLVSLILVFYQSLTTMLDTVLSNRAAAIAIPVAVLITGGILPSITPLFSKWLQDITLFLFKILPWGLDGGSLTRMVVGQPLPAISPIFGTAILIVVFTAIGIWRFKHQEI